MGDSNFPNIPALGQLNLRLWMPKDDLKATYLAKVVIIVTQVAYRQPCSLHWSTLYVFVIQIQFNQTIIYLNETLTEIQG